MTKNTHTREKYRPPYLARKIIDLIKNELSIEELVGEFTDLRMNKDRLTGTCPFCDAHRGSFSVFLNDRSFYCESCLREGDVFQFIMAIDGVTFRDAFKIILSRYCGL